jgi:hypothetical protein
MALTFEDPKPTREPAAPDDGPAAAPLVGNPVLSRRTPPRGGGNLALYVGLPVCVAVVAGLAVFAVRQGGQNQLLTSTAVPVPASAAVATSPPPVALAPAQTASAARETTEPQAAPTTAMANADGRAVERRHTIPHRSAARAAESSAVDTSVTVPKQALASAPEPPAQTAPAEAPAAPTLDVPPPAPQSQ